jgi:hypothetical protein
MKCPTCVIDEKDCPCVNPDCPNHGHCCACVKRHRGLGKPPKCLRFETENSTTKNN